jgi:ankyrin repeat protein
VLLCRATDLILQKQRSLVDERMKEGFSALHIAAANDHVELASALLSKVGGHLDCMSYLPLVLELSRSQPI